MEHDSHYSADHLRLEVREIWDRNAEFWNERMGEGNDFHKLLIEPAQLRLLNLKGGELIREYYVRASRYIRPSVSKGLAMLGQPVPQYYFHRPASVLLNTFFAEGFALEALEEPVFGEQADGTKLFDMVYQEIPPALVARMRLLNE
jgi:hypothetical protein